MNPAPAIEALRKEQQATGWPARYATDVDLDVEEIGKRGTPTPQFLWYLRESGSHMMWLDGRTWEGNSPAVWVNSTSSSFPNGQWYLWNGTRLRSLPSPIDVGLLAQVLDQREYVQPYPNEFIDHTPEHTEAVRRMAEAAGPESAANFEAKLEWIRTYGTHNWKVELSEDGENSFYFRLHHRTLDGGYVYSGNGGIICRRDSDDKPMYWTVHT